MAGSTDAEAGLSGGLALSGPEGLHYLPGHLSPTAQRELLEAVLAVIAEAPLYRPTMPKDGKPFSVRMTNCGPLGWVSDRAGYRYQPSHPESGQPWPAMPQRLLALWRELAGYDAPPEACLVNHYEAGARMGLHRDADEQDRAAPVLSVSLGDRALFRVGGPTRRGATRSLFLDSGDVVVLAGAARQSFHGIDRILPGSSRLLTGTPLGGGRLNLTLRRVNLPSPS